MKSSRRTRIFTSSFTTTITYTFQNDNSTPEPHTRTTQIPITVQLPTTSQSQSQETTAAAVKIQSAYRSHVVRTFIKKISAVNKEVNQLERLIQRQETVDAVRADERESMKMNEALMKLLLSLDEVPGRDQTVRELRRHVSRRIVGLQEILDAIINTRTENWDGFLRAWDDAVAAIEERVCRERGGDYEMEKFCAEKLGFRCFQRFLRDQ